MKFEVEKLPVMNKELYGREELDLARQFAKKAYEEFGTFLKSIVLFGSTARKPTEGMAKGEKGDIDLLMIIDDLRIPLKGDVVETYRIILQKIISDISPRLHITTLKFTTFWEYARNGDPVAVNILRDGVPLIDVGFFEPLQVLLKKGRIRPTFESIWTYFVRAPATLQNSKWHINQAVLDLYWAVIDAAHAALMKTGEIPPSPSHVADLINDKLVKAKLVDKKHVGIMREFYNVSKGIMHREIKYIPGKEYDRYLKNAADFVAAMKKVVERR